MMCKYRIIHYEVDEGKLVEESYTIGDYDSFEECLYRIGSHYIYRSGNVNYEDCFNSCHIFTHCIRIYTNEEHSVFYKIFKTESDNRITLEERTSFTNLFNQLKDLNYKGYRKLSNAFYALPIKDEVEEDD